MTPEKPQPELEEKDFIQNGLTKNPTPLYIWLCIGAFGFALLLGLGNWYNDKLSFFIKKSPFLQVTNRQLSLFLWQNPEFMRVNAKEKVNYLPGFNYLDSVNINIGYADQYVSAPPEVLFRYHTWDRLVKEEFTETPIALNDFKKFLHELPEWHPRYWPAAPSPYIKLVETIDTNTTEDLSKLSKDELPLDVRIAFQGWHNFFIDGEAINNLKPTVAQMEKFITSHPHYARNYWRNVVMAATPKYLATLVSKEAKPDEEIPSDELTSFLRVAYFNFNQKHD